MALISCESLITHWTSYQEKHRSTLITKGFVLILKYDLTWPFFSNSSNKFKIHARLSKVRISIRAASLNVRKDQRNDKFSPGECMLVVLSIQAMWLVGITVAIEIKTLQFTISTTDRRCLLLLYAV